MDIVRIISRLFSKSENTKTNMDQTLLAVQTQNLTRDFETVRAIDNLTLEIPKGIIFGFLGPNGSGKTTTIRVLLGLIKPTSGTALVLNHDIHTDSEKIRKKCGAVLENHGLYDRLSAEDNLEFYGRIWQIPQKERKIRIQELLEQINLWERRKEKVSTWSKGMQQKLAITRALMHHPEIVFLDEPTAGLDPIAANALRNDLAKLAKNEGITFFMNTHNLAEAEKLCSLVGVIHNGHLLALDHPDHLRTQSSHPSVDIKGEGFTQKVIEEIKTIPEITQVTLHNNGLTLNLAQNINISFLINKLVGMGVEIDEVRKEKLDLEDVFLALVEQDNKNND
jgi:ABC-2 type transport system ATP-binding protein